MAGGLERQLQLQVRALAHLPSSALLPKMPALQVDLLRAAGAAPREADCLDWILEDPRLVEGAAHWVFSEELNFVRRASRGTHRAPPDAYLKLPVSQRAAYEFLRSLPEDWEPFVALDELGENSLTPPIELTRILRCLQAAYQAWRKGSNGPDHATLTELSGELLALPDDTDPVAWLRLQKGRDVVRRALRDAINGGLGPPYGWLGSPGKTIKSKVRVCGVQGISIRVLAVTLHSGGFMVRSVLAVPLSLVGKGKTEAHALSWNGFDTALDDQGSGYLLQLKDMRGYRRRSSHIQEIDQIAFPALAAWATRVTFTQETAEVTTQSMGASGEVRLGRLPTQIGPFVVVVRIRDLGPPGPP